jgi:iron complex transport system substrate-binding protein
MTNEKSDINNLNYHYTMKYALALIALIFFGCKEKLTDPRSVSSDTTTVELKYAVGFKVSDVGKARLVEVTYPFQGAKSGYKYLLVPRGEATPSHDAETKVITIPITTIACTSTSHIPLLDFLDETKSLTGFPTLDYISSTLMRKRIDAGELVELGVDKGINLERLAVLQPQLVMAYTMTGDYGQFKKMEELGIPVVLNADYLEKHPLGRAEWIKFMALFFGKEDMADSVFNAIEQEYLKTKALAATAAYRPTVMSGIVYGDAWFLPGGDNYAARLLKDAACDYMWKDDSTQGFLQFGFERIFEKAHDADLWIGTGAYTDMKSLTAADARYKAFKPAQTGKVFTNDARHGAKGGSEFLELGYLRPDIILKDLVKIAHPELLPEHELYFHKKLE